jgi:16S rRNA processing protein RimM
VLAIRSYPTCDVLVVDRGEGRELEVPLLETYVAGVEPEHGVVRIVTLEGLD